MEYNEQNGFLEELLALRTDPSSWDVMISTGVNEFYTNGWNYGGFDDNHSSVILPSSSFEELSNFPLHQSLNCSINEFYQPFVDGQFSVPDQVTDSSSCNNLVSQEQYSLSVLDDENQALADNVLCIFEQQAACKLEAITELPSSFDMGIVCVEGKNKVGKKLDGQPSKNLMAERRRRKRLNDRLSLLRSVVPKISKMDRTSILGDTIDYMKELLGRINCLQEEIESVGNSNQLKNIVGIFKNVKDNEALVRNTPRFDVERRPNKNTQIDVCCAGKPGMLLSTITTLEALGLDVQQCVVSCFNDFAMQASCSDQALDHMVAMSSEDIKEALFKNAGYGGMCL